MQQKLQAAKRFMKDNATCLISIGLGMIMVTIFLILYFIIQYNRPSSLAIITCPFCQIILTASMAVHIGVRILREPSVLVLVLVNITSCIITPIAFQFAPRFKGETRVLHHFIY